MIRTTSPPLPMPKFRCVNSTVSAQATTAAKRVAMPSSSSIPDTSQTSIVPWMTAVSPSKRWKQAVSHAGPSGSSASADHLTWPSTTSATDAARHAISQGASPVGAPPSAFLYTQ